MRLKLFLPLFAVAAAAVLVWAMVPWGEIVAWATAAQRDFQNAMARALRAVQAGDPAAIWALCSATAAYGFVHALGPGHGKVLLGGAALASGATLRRMTVLTLLSSLAQALSAILIVGGIAVLFGIGARQLGVVADTWLAPASYAAIAAVGAYLVARGLRMWPQGQATHCCHAHGPSLKDTETLSGMRDAALLIGSIALRPCTGALFLLVIALRFEVFWIGCLAVLTMGLGTAAFNLLVAWSGVAARRLSAVSVLAGDDVRRVSASLHIAGGSFVMLVSLAWLLRFAT
jgi:nickel/cobalt exporter